MKKPVAWFIYRYFGSLFGYGVRFSRMFVAIALIFEVGTFIFTQKGAVSLKQDNQHPSKISFQGNNTARQSLTHRDAFLLTLRLFLPTKIPIIGKWGSMHKPSKVS